MSTSPKQRLLHIMKILLSETDEQHTLTATELIAKLALYGINAERKSVYADIELLGQFGIDIELTRGRSHGYYVASRDFELAEVKLLVDAVQSSRLITERKSQELIAKLSTLVSVPQAKQLRRQIYIAGRAKGINESVYYSVDSIHTAINENKKICFKYFEYDVNKERVYRRNGGAYTQTPVALWWSEDNYYLIAYSAKYDDLVHYRVDRMSDVAVALDACDSFDRNQFNAAEHGKRVFGMYSGEAVMATIAFDANLVSVLLDHFGADVSLRQDDERVVVTAEVSQSPVFFGRLMQFGKRAEIIAPDSLRNALRDAAAEIASVYG